MHADSNEYNWPITTKVTKRKTNRIYWTFFKHFAFLWAHCPYQSYYNTMIDYSKWVTWPHYITSASAVCLPKHSKRKSKYMLVKEGNYYHFVLKWTSLFNAQIVNWPSVYLPMYLYFCKCCSFAGNKVLNSS